MNVCGSRGSARAGRLTVVGVGIAGWYDDLEDPSVERYFDGTHWTDSVRPRSGPSRLSTSDTPSAGPSAEELRQREWQEGFPAWDTAVPRGNEPGLPSRPDRAGFDAMSTARLASRIGAGGWGNVLILVGVLAAIVIVFLVLMH